MASLVDATSSAASVAGDSSSQSRPPSSGGVALHSNRSLYVGGLADSCQNATLRASLVPFGPIKSIDVPMDYEKGTHRGFAFVEFEDPDDAEECRYNMDGAELLGRTLTVNLAQSADKVKLGSTKATWSQDEWFQQAQGDGETKERQEKERTEAGDADGLKEKMAAPDR